MRRIICFALFGLLVSSEAAFAQGQHWVRPQGVSGPRFGWHARIYHPHLYSPQPHYFDPFRYFVQDFSTPYSGYHPIVPFSPTYFFLPSESASHPRLVFKDHMTYTVEDYWRVDDELHFITSEDGGTKSVPHTVPFSELDIQATTDALTAQGFKFRVRDEPIDQWLQHHAQLRAAASKTSGGTPSRKRNNRAR
jgi:hypothetical protein